MRSNQIFFATALCAALVAGCPGASVRPTKERVPLQTDFDQCYVNAKRLGQPNLQGKAVVKMYVAADGAVPFAFINSHNVDGGRQLFGCLTNFIVGAKLPGEGTDYLRPYGPIQFQGMSAILPATTEVAQDPMDVEVAQSTLEFADWADATDKGWGYFYVKKHKEAQDAFRGVLATKPDEVRALRGLASALAASGGDLKEAKDLAAKAIQLKGDSAATHEAMLRVCLAMKDDLCTFESFEKARNAPDSRVRSIELATLQPEAKEAAVRLQKTEHERHEQEVAKAKAAAEEQAKKLDPHGCSKKPEGDERTLCFVKGCFDKGGHTYAESLKGLTGQEYQAGDWKIAGIAGGASKVTLPIRAKGGQPHDANWEVKVGETVSMKPLDIDANNIAMQYNACKK